MCDNVGLRAKDGTNPVRYRMIKKWQEPYWEGGDLVGGGWEYIFQAAYRFRCLKTGKYYIKWEDATVTSINAPEWEEIKY